MEKVEDRKAFFQTPPRKYRGKPFWAWNGKLEEKELLRQIDVFKQMGFGGFFMHSRVGLETEYLGKEWFEAIETCTEYAGRCGMEPWLYDEDRWPSGSAGGLATREIEYRASFLQVTRIEAGELDWRKIDRNLKRIVACFACCMDQNDFWGKRTLEKEGVLHEGEVALIFSVVTAPEKEVYNGHTYLDTMNKDAVMQFIEVTHETYGQKLSSEAQAVISGIFTDEPHRGPMFTRFNGGEECWVPYTPKLFPAFLGKYGYDLKEYLPELFYIKRGEMLSKVTYHYIELCQELFLENFAKPIQQWCHKNGMQLTGHVLHEDSLSAQTLMQGSLMRFYEYMDVPGIDHLLRDNYCFWIVKQVVSVAKQFGKEQVLSELYGATGWKATLEEYKQIGDWQALFGVNLRCPHLSWYTMKGEAKRDYPASISYHLAGWKEYHYLEDYFSRIHVFLEAGEEREELLVISPIESVWARSYSGAYDVLEPRDSLIQQIEDKYKMLFGILTTNQIGFDYGEEALMGQHAFVEDGVLTIGNCHYRKVIICGMYTIRSSTLKLLGKFQNQGGKIIFIGEIPKYVDAELSDEAGYLLENAVQIPFEKQQIAAACEEERIVSVEGNGCEDILACKREDAFGISYMLLNQNREKGRERLRIRFNGSRLFQNGQVMEVWNARTGEVEEIPFECTKDDSIYKWMNFAPGEEKLLRIRKAEITKPNKHESMAGELLRLPAKYSYVLSEKNICVLDKVRAQFETEDGGIHTIEQNEVLCSDRMYRSMLGKQVRGGEMLQPWYQNKYCKETEESKSVILRYEFTLDAELAAVELVLENIERVLQISVNGVPVVVSDKGSWIDTCMRKIELPGNLLKTGKNEIKVKQEFCGQDGFEAAYLLGDFSVHLSENSLPVLKALPEHIVLGDITTQGFPFYSGKITYCMPQVYREKVQITMKEWNGWTITVTDAWDREHFVGFAPYKLTCDGIKAVNLSLTRKNTFGPLHEVNPDPPVCEPISFLTTGADWTDFYVLQSQGVTDFQIRNVNNN